MNPTFSIQISYVFFNIMDFRRKGARAGDRDEHVPLVAGTIVTMAGPTQRNWLHAVAPGKGERVNITFRNVKEPPSAPGKSDDCMCGPCLVEDTVVPEVSSSLGCALAHGQVPCGPDVLDVPFPVALCRLDEVVHGWDSASLLDSSKNT